MLWGNHDMVYKDEAYVKKHLSSYFEPIDDKAKELRLNTAGSFTYEIVKGLKYKINGGVDYRKEDRS